MISHFVKCMNNYATFDGRATRSEYWYFNLCYLILFLLVLMVNETMASVVTLILLVPSLAVTSRRLHDIGKSGWFQLLIFIPLIGAIILLYWYVQDSEAANEHGPNPKMPLATHQ